MMYQNGNKEHQSVFLSLIADLCTRNTKMTQLHPLLCLQHKKQKQQLVELNGKRFNFDANGTAYCIQACDTTQLHKSETSIYSMGVRTTVIRYSTINKLTELNTVAKDMNTVHIYLKVFKCHLFITTKIHLTTYYIMINIQSTFFVKLFIYYNCSYLT